jgi:hypothetical protein
MEPSPRQREEKDINQPHWFVTCGNGIEKEQMLFLGKKWSCVKNVLQTKLLVKLNENN